MRSISYLFLFVFFCAFGTIQANDVLTVIDKECITNNLENSTSDELYIGNTRYLISACPMSLKKDGEKYKELYPRAGDVHISYGSSFGTYGQQSFGAYYFTWRITNKQLYLKEVKGIAGEELTTHYSSSEIKEILEKYMDRKFCSKGLFAHQLSGVLYAKPANLVDMPNNVPYGSDEYWEPYNEWYAQPIYRLTFEKGKLVEMIPMKEVEDENHAYAIVQQRPQFSEEKGALGKYLKENIKYPAECKEKKQEGKVEISFIIEKDGSVTEAMVWRSSGYAVLDEAAKSAISVMPRWIKPGKKYGKTVRTKIILPIPFSIP